MRTLFSPPGKLPLFRLYPRLGQRSPYVSLGRFPTPVEKLAAVGRAVGVERLYVKRDDMSGEAYGGNKVRKLEFLLGDARQANAREVITFGFAGSNHALATAVYAGELGMHSSSLLLPQVNAHYVRRNLLASHGVGADLHHGNRWLLTWSLLCKLVTGWLKHGVFPKVIPAGGTCPLGVLGYLNAVLELKEQIEAGEVPEPDLIYVPLGSMGTAAGLTLGLKVAGLKSRLVAVRVIEEEWTPSAKILRLLRKTVRFIRSLDATFPELRFSEADLRVRDDCLGEGYARFTERGVRAAELMRQEEGIVLNGTYSAKAFSALLDDAAGKTLAGKTVLFWNTYSSRDLSAWAAGVDYHRLPKGLHRYFEEEVQPLDRKGADR